MSENDKTVQQYRRNIFILKSRLAEEEEAVAKLKQQYSPYNISEDESIMFKLKARILELAIAELGNEQRKFAKHKASMLYALMFAVRKLLKSSEILAVTPEMMFRGADIKLNKAVPFSHWENTLKDIYKIPGDSIAVITEVLRSITLSPLNKKHEKEAQKDVLTEENWEYFLECFLIKKEARKSKKPPPYEDAYNKLIYLLIANKILLDGFWTDDKLDMPEFAFELVSELKEMSYLEAIAVFSRFDPAHSGFVIKEDLIYKLQQKMQEAGRQDRFVLKK